MDMENVPMDLRPSQGWAHLGMSLARRHYAGEEHPEMTVPEWDGHSPEGYAAELYDLLERLGSAPVSVVLTWLSPRVKDRHLSEEEVLVRAIKDGPIWFSFYRLPTV
jgi:hypothetical protein